MRTLDLSKEVLWVSVSQRAANLPAGKVGDLKKNSATRPGSRPGRMADFFFKPPTLLAGSSAAL